MTEHADPHQGENRFSWESTVSNVQPVGGIEATEGINIVPIHQFASARRMDALATLTVRQLVCNSELTTRSGQISKDRMGRKLPDDQIGELIIESEYLDFVEDREPEENYDESVEKTRDRLKKALHDHRDTTYVLLGMDPGTEDYTHMGFAWHRTGPHVGQRIIAGEDGNAAVPPTEQFVMVWQDETPLPQYPRLLASVLATAQKVARVPVASHQAWVVNDPLTGAIHDAYEERASGFAPAAYQRIIEGIGNVWYAHNGARV